MRRYLKCKEPYESILRWILFLPLSILSAFAANLFIILLHIIVDKIDYGGIGNGWIDFPLNLFETFVENSVMGAALIYVAAFVAPSHNKVVAVVVSGLFLLVNGTILPFILNDSDKWGIFKITCSIIGSLIVAWMIVTEELTFDGDTKR